MIDFRKSPTVLNPVVTKDQAVEVVDHLKYLDELQRVHFYQKLRGFNVDSLLTLVLWTLCVTWSAGLGLLASKQEARML